MNEIVNAMNKNRIIDYHLVRFIYTMLQVEDHQRSRGS